MNNISNTQINSPITAIKPLYLQEIKADYLVLNSNKENQGDSFKMLFSEKIHQLKLCAEVLCVTYFDESYPNEKMASMYLEKHANKNINNLKSQQEVDLFILKQTDLGYKCLINGQYIGLLYNNEVFQELLQNQTVTGYVKSIRPDGRIDLILRAAGHLATDNISEHILKLLKQQNGRLEITDKTDPEIIYKLFNASKKKFKVALGRLYKSHLITIHENEIRLV